MTRPCVTTRARVPFVDRLAASETRDAIRLAIPVGRRMVMISAPRAHFVDDDRALDPISLLVTGFGLASARSPLRERRRLRDVLLALAALPADILAEAAGVLLADLDPVPGSPQTVAARIGAIAAGLAGAQGEAKIRAAIGDEATVKSARASEAASEGRRQLAALAACRRPVAPVAAFSGPAVLAGGLSR